MRHRLKGPREQGLSRTTLLECREFIDFLNDCLEGAIGLSHAAIAQRSVASQLEQAQAVNDIVHGGNGDVAKGQASLHKGGSLLSVAAIGQPQSLHGQIEDGACQSAQQESHKSMNATETRNMHAIALRHTCTSRGPNWRTRHGNPQGWKDVVLNPVQNQSVAVGVAVKGL